MRSGRLSIFAAASWLVPLFVFPMLLLYLENSSRGREQSLLTGFDSSLGSWLVSLGIAAGLAFILGLLSLLCTEPVRWIGAIPCFLGALYLCWFDSAILGPRERSVFGAIQRSPCLTMGIPLALIGVFILTWFSPRALAHPSQGQDADGSGEKDARRMAGAVKLFGIATLIVGVAFILNHAIEFF